MEAIIFMIISFMAGIFFPMQSGMNGRLRENVHSPYLSGAISNLLGATIMLIVGFFLRHQIPMVKPQLTGPWWMWCGGIVSAFVVFSSIVSPPKIGYSTSIILMLVAQIIMSTLIDNFGWFGANVIPITPKMVIGILVIIVGIIIVKF